MAIGSVPGLDARAILPSSQPNRLQPARANAMRNLWRNLTGESAFKPINSTRAGGLYTGAAVPLSVLESIPNRTVQNDAARFAGQVGGARLQPSFQSTGVSTG